MQEAYSLATKNANKSTARGRNQHDKKATFTKLLLGDRMYYVMLLNAEDQENFVRSGRKLFIA